MNETIEIIATAKQEPLPEAVVKALAIEIERHMKAYGLAEVKVSTRRLPKRDYTPSFLIAFIVVGLLWLAYFWHYIDQHPGGIGP